MIKELKNVEVNDIEDMVFRMELTYHEVVEIQNILPQHLSDLLYNLVYMKLVILP